MVGVTLITIIVAMGTIFASLTICLIRLFLAIIKQVVRAFEK